MLILAVPLARFVNDASRPTHPPNGYQADIVACTSKAGIKLQNKWATIAEQPLSTLAYFIFQSKVFLHWSHLTFFLPDSPKSGRLLFFPRRDDFSREKKTVQALACFNLLYRYFFQLYRTLNLLQNMTPWTTYTWLNMLLCCFYFWCYVRSPLESINILGLKTMTARFKCTDKHTDGPRFWRSQLLWRRVGFFLCANIFYCHTHELLLLLLLLPSYPSGSNST